MRECAKKKFKYGERKFAITWKMSEMFVQKAFRKQS